MAAKNEESCWIEKKVEETYYCYLIIHNTKGVTWKAFVWEGIWDTLYLPTGFSQTVVLIYCLLLSLIYNESSSLHSYSSYTNWKLEFDLLISIFDNQIPSRIRLILLEMIKM